MSTQNTKMSHLNLFSKVQILGYYKSSTNDCTSGGLSTKFGLLSIVFSSSKHHNMSWLAKTVKSCLLIISQCTTFEVIPWRIALLPWRPKDIHFSFQIISTGLCLSSQSLAVARILLLRYQFVTNTTLISLLHFS